MNTSTKKDILITISVIILLIMLGIWSGPQLSQMNDTITGEQVKNPADDTIFPYTLTHPSNKFKLPHCLDEISGLSYFSQNKLACIQDEKGTMYIFDTEQEKVIEKFKFGEKKDYEDIEIVGKSAYILQSNGSILKVKHFETNAPKVKKYNTLLSGKNDAEGLAFDNESNVLLIACKGSPYLEEKYPALKGKRAVYQFDLETKKLRETPACIIDMKYLKTPERHSLFNIKSFIELIKIFDHREGDVNFRPSGIAVHPKTKNVYIISSADNMLIVLNREGHIIAAKELDKKIFKQPEGICFSPEGDLYISNEKKSRRANILKFDYKQ